MIVREEGSSYLLITQPDHARLAGEIVAAIHNEPSLHGPERDTLLLACREHDNGWTEIDAHPTVDPLTGRPYDFISGPLHVKLDVWLRGITRVARANPHAAALVAEHALTVYAYRREEPSWAQFFVSITSLRDDLLAQIGATNGPRRQAFDDGYRCVRLGDSFSLQFCNAWEAPQQTLGYTGRLEAQTLVISPDPFAGTHVPLRIEARAIPARRYVDDADLRTEIAAARRMTITGSARGEPAV
jgi:hypothetical protein